LIVYIKNWITVRLDVIKKINAKNIDIICKYELYREIEIVGRITSSLNLSRNSIRYS